MSAKEHRPYRIAYLHRSPSGLETSYMASAAAFLRELESRGEIVLDVKYCKTRKNKETVWPSIAELHTGKYDGIVVSAIDSDAYFHELEALNLPVVALDHAPLARKTDSVTFDGFQGGALAARVLIERGHRDILFVPKYDFDYTAPKGTDPRIEDPTSTERRTGVQQELAKHSDVTCWPVLPYINTPNTHLHLSRDLLADLERLIAHFGKPPSAILSHDVNTCYGIASLVEKIGLKVPQDISMIGFRAATTGEDAVIMKRPISHVIYSSRDMGHAGWELLHERLTGKRTSSAPCKRLSIPGTFVDLGSVKDLR